jgi:Spy/CpxP family protein refolding chaperone
MRDRALAALLTLAVFAAGFGAGLWAERHRPLPPPPAAFMGEYGARRGPGARMETPVNRAQLREQIDAIRPQMEAFKARILEIYGQFDRDMETVLTPEQKEVYESRFRSQRTFGTSREMAGDKPLSDDQIEMLLQRPFRTLSYFVVVPMTLERMTTELKLDEAQREKVRDFLRVRREKFIELVDSSPPLSLMLSRLAPIAQRLSEPVKAAAEPAH